MFEFTSFCVAGSWVADRLAFACVTESSKHHVRVPLYIASLYIASLSLDRLCGEFTTETDSANMEPQVRGPQVLSQMYPSMACSRHTKYVGSFFPLGLLKIWTLTTFAFGLSPKSVVTVDFLP